MSELIKRASTGHVTYASAGVGSTLHINGAMFAHRLKIDMEHVPYKGSATALPDVAAGRVTLIFGGFSGIAPYLSSGKLRALAVTDSKRLPALPDIPTLMEQGVPFTYTYWLGLLAPAGTPPAVVKQLSNALNHAARDKEVVSRFEAEGSAPWTSSPEEFKRYLENEITETAKLVKALNIPKD